MDTWFAMDPNTGVKQEIVSFNKPDKTCPIDSSDAVYIGRSGKQYLLILIKTVNILYLFSIKSSFE